MYLFFNLLESLNKLKMGLFNFIGFFIMDVLYLLVNVFQSHGNDSFSCRQLFEGSLNLRLKFHIGGE